MEIALLFIGCGAASLLIRLWVGAANRSRIRTAIRERGDEIVDIQWAPFGPGWFGNQNTAIYRVRYRTQRGVEREVYAQTGPFASVYFREDRPIRSGNPAAAASWPEGGTRDERPAKKR